MDKAFEKFRNRRSVRQYEQVEIDLEAVKECIDIAALAPNGANKQPWTFVLVTDQNVKEQIRSEAEAIETAFYKEKAGDKWKDDLKHLKTDNQKPFLSEASALIVVFEQRKGIDGDQHYYVKESTAIAIGMLINCLTLKDFNTLTYTPAPASFLNKLLNRPENEKAVMILPVGKMKTGYEPIQVEKKTRSEYLIEI